MRLNKNITGEFTEREQEIYKLLINGVNKYEICKRLFLTHSTIQTHISNIYRKKEVEGRHALQELICNHYKTLLKEMGVQDV